jgi:CRISPR-associated protein Cas5t
MEVLRIKAFQETACYTKPFANKVTETYPLPPYSSVKGLIHSVMNADRLLPFSLSIQGDYETQIVDYRKTYFVKKHEFAMPIILDGIEGHKPSYDTKVMSSMPLYTHMLYHVHLIIHIKAEKELLQEIYHAFNHTTDHLSLGRQEDLLRIDEVSFVEVQEVDQIKLKHSIYVPKTMLDERQNGVPYLINWTYQIKKGIRQWTRIPVLYLAKNTFIDDEVLKEPLLVDRDKYPVLWNV